MFPRSVRLNMLNNSTAWVYFACITDPVPYQDVWRVCIEPDTYDICTIAEPGRSYKNSNRLINGHPRVTPIPVPPLYSPEHPRASVLD